MHGRETVIPVEKARDGLEGIFHTRGGTGMKEGPNGQPRTTDIGRTGRNLRLQAEQHHQTVGGVHGDGRGRHSGDPITDTIRTPGPHGGKDAGLRAGCRPAGRRHAGNSRKGTARVCGVVIIAGAVAAVCIAATVYNKPPALPGDNPPAVSRINARQVSLRLAEKVRLEQPAPRGRGGGSTPYPAPAPIKSNAPGPGTGEVSPRFARSLTRPPATRTDSQLPIANCRLPIDKNFFAAIRTEESYDGKVLIGDGGLSKGPYHIGRDYWTDGCEQGGVKWDYDTLVWSRPHCEQIMLWYWQRYCPDALARGVLEVLARIHNGGPKGDRKTATLEYWRRIQKHMAKGGPINQ